MCDYCRNKANDQKGTSLIKKKNSKSLFPSPTIVAPNNSDSYDL